MKPAPKWVLAIAGAGYLFLHLPVLVLVVFSFNASRYSVGWTGFTLDWYRALAGRADLWRGLRASLIVGTISTVAAASRQVNIPARMRINDNGSTGQPSDGLNSDVTMSPNEISLPQS